MKVKFLRDYRGRETGENLVREGETWDIDEKELNHLGNEEVIERVKDLPLLELAKSQALAPKAKTKKR